MRLKLGGRVRIKLLSFQLLIICFYALLPILSSSEHSAYFKDMFPILLLQAIYIILNKGVHVSRKALLYMALFVSAFISTAFSSMVQIQRTMITYLLLCVMTIIFEGMRYTKRDIEQFIRFYIGFGAICSGLIILSWVFHVEYQWNRYSIDIIGLHKNPNYLNNIILLALVFVIDRIIHKKGKLLVNISLCLLMVFAVFLTGTRAALLCIVLLCTFVFIYICFVQQKFAYIILLLVLIGGAYYLVMNFISADILNRLMGEDALSDTGRLFMWGNALKAFVKQSILGMGLNGVTAYNRTISSVDNIHNVLLQFLCDQGLVGASIFVSIFIMTFRRVRRNDRLLFFLMTIALYFPILFQNGTISFAFWWPITILEIFSSVSERSGICDREYKAIRINKCI